MAGGVASCGSVCGCAWGRIRGALIEESLLYAVSGVRGNLCPTTSTPVAILVFDRAREKGGTREACQDVLFIDASRDYQSGKNQNALLDKHMITVMGTFRARQSADKYAHVASLMEIAAPVQNLMATLTEMQRQDVKQRLLESASQFRRGERITFPLAVRMVAARKPL